MFIFNLINLLFEFFHLKKDSVDFRFSTKPTLISRKEETVGWSSLFLLYFSLLTNLLFFIKKYKMK